MIEPITSPPNPAPREGPAQRPEPPVAASVRETTTILSRAWRFLKGERQLWIAGGSIVLFSILSRLCADTLPSQLIYAGTMMQLAGIGAVAYGLYDLRTQFERPGMLEKLRAVRKPPTYRGIVAGVSEAPVVSSEATYSQGRRAGRRLTGRIAALEAQVDEVQALIRSITDGNKKDLDEVRRRLSSEERARTMEDKAVRELLESATIGGLQLEMAGVILLFVGVICTSVPNLTASAIYLLLSLTGFA